jgi:hypothetical protein
MARKHLPYDPVSWRAIANDVHAEEMRLGMEYLRAHEHAKSGPRVFGLACQIVGERRGIDGRVIDKQVVRLRCLDAEKHAKAVRRAARRWRGEG